MNEVNKHIKTRLKNGNLIYNLCIRIKVNKYDIKDINTRDFNYIIIEISSPEIKNNLIELIGINCSDNFNFNMEFPGTDVGYSYSSPDMNPLIHMGVKAENFENYWKINGEDTLLHLLIHVFELMYGYKNKNLKKYDEPSEDYENYSSNTEDEYNWKSLSYWGDDAEYTPYLTNLLSIFRNVYEQLNNKQNVIKLFNETDFNNINSVKELEGILTRKYNMYSTSALVWLYHLRKNNKSLFDTTKKKIINKILKF